MSLRFAAPTLLGLAGLSLAAPAAAQSDGLRQLGAHQHGAAQLAIAADASGAVLAELTTPAFNLYVFEHAPRTDAERAVVAEAARALSSGAMLGFPERAGCTLAETRISGADGDHDAEDHHHDEDDAHDHDHDHAHDDHDHEHEHDHDAGGHADIVVSWSYACANTGAINRVELGGLFGAFPAFETVETQFFDGARAAAADLTGANPTLRID